MVLRVQLVGAAISAPGEAYSGGTMRRGRHATRVSVVNWRALSADVGCAVPVIEVGFYQFKVMG